MVKIGVVILSYAKTDEYRQMTQLCIDTLLASETGGIKYHICVVETNPDCGWFNRIQDFVQPNEKFNYNKFLNIGLKTLFKQKDLDYILISNNDVTYSQEWAKEIILDSFLWKLDSACPFSGQTNDHGVKLGYNIGEQLTGWCILFTKATMKALYPLDEQFAFWYQDNDIAEQLKIKGKRHGLVYDSRIAHRTSSSHSLLNEEDKHLFTYGMRELFEAKYKEKDNGIESLSQ